MTLRGGLDLGGTKIEAIVVGDANEICGQSRIPTPTEGGPAAVVRELSLLRPATRAPRSR